LCFKQSDSEVGEAEQKSKKLNQDVHLIKQNELKVQQELRGWSWKWPQLMGSAVKRIFYHGYSSAAQKFVGEARGFTNDLNLHSISFSPVVVDESFGGDHTSRRSNQVLVTLGKGAV
jgi:hypothetical protein